MTPAEENCRLLLEIQANRDFLLLAYRQNPALLKFAEPDVRLVLGLPEDEAEKDRPNPGAQTDAPRE